MISRRFLGMSSAALLGSAVIGEAESVRLITGPAGNLDRRDISWIRAATTRFRELETEHGGMAAYGAARGLAEQVVGALRSSTPNQELYVAVSGLCRVTAWSAFDAGRRRAFWQCHATALDLANRAGDTDTVVMIIQDAGRAEIHSGRHQAAAKLFELISARRPLDAVTWGLLGSAYAPNSPESTKLALRHIRSAEGSNTPDAIAMSGHLNLDLGNHPSAIEAFQNVLPMRSGVVAIQDTTPLATAHLRAGEVRIGVQYVENALTLAEQVRSATATKALVGVGAELAAQKDSTAQDLAQRISTLTA